MPGALDPLRFWAVAVGSRRRLAPALGDPDLTAAGGDGIAVWFGDMRDAIDVVADDRGLALLHGAPRGRLPDEATVDATALLRAYRRCGESLAGSLRGRFVALAWDGDARRLLLVRDQMGALPLFYAARDGGLVVSMSPEMVAGSGRAAPQPDPVAVADWVLTGLTAVEDTLWRDVRRLPAGHRATFAAGTLRSTRYWRPAIGGPAEDAAREGVLARFDAAFDTAVARCLEAGPATIFLSGGIDSALVAATATGLLAGRGQPPPAAVSFVFPDRHSSEEDVQRAIAGRLGLRQTMIRLQETIEGPGLLRAGLEGAAPYWIPSGNPWGFAYERAARSAAAEGCRTALSGDGGNELLEVPWGWTSDLLLRGRVRPLLGLARAQARMVTRPRELPARTWLRWLVLNEGLRPVARAALLEVGAHVAPDRLARRRRQRAAARLPAWAVPDPAVRERLLERRSRPHPVELGDRQASTRLEGLASPHLARLLEEDYLTGLRTGVEYRSPYYDVDLVELVSALPAQALLLDGQVKGVAYASLRRRGMAAIADRLRPAYFDGVVATALEREAGSLVDALGGLSRLGALGVIDATSVETSLRGLGSSTSLEYYPSWQLFAMESWLRVRHF